jgi:hypothetical protein
MAAYINYAFWSNPFKQKLAAFTMPNNASK